ncbi:MAG: hypothetical protein ACO1SV_18315 [Fimbriimonas sp.]
MLSDLQTLDAVRCETDGVLAVWREEDGFAGSGTRGIVVECEAFEVPDGTQVSNLFVSPYFFGEELAQAFQTGLPMSVLIYWREGGAPWTPFTIAAAERFRLGLGGALAAVLVPLQEARSPSGLHAYQNA